MEIYYISFALLLHLMWNWNSFLFVYYVRDLDIDCFKLKATFFVGSRVYIWSTLNGFSLITCKFEDLRLDKVKSLMFIPTHQITKLTPQLVFQSSCNHIFGPYPSSSNHHRQSTLGIHFEKCHIIYIKLEFFLSYLLLSVISLMIPLFFLNPLRVESET